MKDGTIDDGPLDLLTEAMDAAVDAGHRVAVARGAFRNRGMQEHDAAIESAFETLPVAIGRLASAVAIVEGHSGVPDSLDRDP
jgi:hypothetical protein